MTTTERDRYDSAASTGREPPLRLRVLISFHYFQNTDLDEVFARHFTEPYPEVFLDSGAFSAATLGAGINLTAYQRFIERYRHLITTYSNLDVIGDPAATWVNQQRMEDAGFRPLPVFHGGSDWSWLEQYIDRYPYVAIGGIAGMARKPMSWLVRCFKMAEGRAVFHGFGVTSWRVLKALPWYSVDSTTWGAGVRYGRVSIFDEHRGRFASLPLGEREQWARHAAIVRQLGFEPADFADRERNTREKISSISAISFMLAERWLRGWHGEIPIPGGDDRGPKLHLVAGPSAESTMGLRMLGEAVAGPQIYLAETRMADLGVAQQAHRRYHRQRGE